MKRHQIKVCMMCHEGYECSVYAVTRLYCDECKPKSLLANSNRYHATEKGRESLRRNSVSVKGLAGRKLWPVENRERSRESKAAYKRTEKGQLAVARATAARYGALDAEEFGLRRTEMVRLRQPCESCGNPFTAGRNGHQLDHVVPLALCTAIGVDNPNGAWNLQVLCLGCHNQKSSGDRSLVREVKLCILSR